MTPLEQITELEQTLLQAMLKSDVKVLNNLISDDLIFTDQAGNVLTKKDDIETHRSGKLVFEYLKPSEQVIKLYDRTAVVSVLLKIKGKYMDQPFQMNNRYSRVWVQIGDSWKIVIAHSGSIPTI